MFLKHLLFLQALALAVLGQTAHRVEDNDAQITYTPLASWHRNVENNDHDSGGYHMVTDDPTATATFTFTGTGFSFLAPLYADSITAAVALDGESPVTVDLSDPTQTLQDGGPSTQSSAVRWQRMGLPNVQHTLVVSVPAGQTFAVVDALIYYTGDTATTSSDSSSTPPSLSSSSSTLITAALPTTTGESNSQSPSKPPIGAIVGGLLGGLALLLLVLLFLCNRRRKHIQLRDSGDAVHEPFDMTRERHQGAGVTVVSTMSSTGAVDKTHTSQHSPVPGPAPVQHPAARSKRVAEDAAPVPEPPAPTPVPANHGGTNPSSSFPNAIFHEDSGIRVPAEGPDGILEFPPMYTVS